MAIGLSFVKHVEVGLVHSVALRLDGTVTTWGDNPSGQLATGSLTPAVRTLPGQVPNLFGVVKIASGWLHLLALMPDTSVRSWGFNAGGELGDRDHHHAHFAGPHPVSHRRRTISAGIGTSMATSSSDSNYALSISPSAAAGQSVATVNHLRRHWSTPRQGRL